MVNSSERWKSWQIREIKELGGYCVFIYLFVYLWLKKLGLIKKIAKLNR